MSCLLSVTVGDVAGVFIRGYIYLKESVMFQARIARIVALFVLIGLLVALADGVEAQESCEIKINLYSHDWGEKTLVGLVTTCVSIPDALEAQLRDFIETLPHLDISDEDVDWQSSCVISVEISQDTPVFESDCYDDLLNREMAWDSDALIVPGGRLVTPIQGFLLYIDPVQILWNTSQQVLKGDWVVIYAKDTQDTDREGNVWTLGYGGKLQTAGWIRTAVDSPGLAVVPEVQYAMHDNLGKVPVVGLHGNNMVLTYVRDEFTLKYFPLSEFANVPIDIPELEYSFDVSGIQSVLNHVSVSLSEQGQFRGDFHDTQDENGTGSLICTSLHRNAVLRWYRMPEGNKVMQWIQGDEEVVFQPDLAEYLLDVSYNLGEDAGKTARFAVDLTNGCSPDAVINFMAWQ